MRSIASAVATVLVQASRNSGPRTRDKELCELVSTLRLNRAWNSWWAPVDHTPSLPLTLTKHGVCFFLQKGLVPSLGREGWLATLLDMASCQLFATFAHVRPASTLSSSKRRACFFFFVPFLGSSVPYSPGPLVSLVSRSSGPLVLWSPGSIVPCSFVFLVPGHSRRRHFSDRRHVGVRRHFPSALPIAIALPVVKPCAREKTVVEDRSGEATRRGEDTWARDDMSRRQVGRAHASSRRHMGFFLRTGRAKTRVVALPEDRSGEDTRRREDTWAKTLPEDRSGKDPRRREHMWARRHVGMRRHLAKTGRANTLIVARARGRHIERQPRETCVLNCWEVLPFAANCKHANPAPAWRHPKRFMCGASCPCGVKKPFGVGGCGVKTRRE